MRKIISLIAALAILAAFTVSCGGKAKDEPKKAEKVADIPEPKRLGGSKTIPAWLDDGDKVGEFEGKKVIFFTGIGKSVVDEQTALAEAELAAATAAAQSIKLIASKQVAKAWEAIGAGEDQTKEQVMKGLEAMSAKDVNVSGLRKAGTYWEKVIEPVIEPDGTYKGRWSKPVYKYYIRFAMDYDRFEALRDGTIEKTKKEVKLNDRQKKLYADMEAKLNELDASQSGGIE